MTSDDHFYYEGFSSPNGTIVPDDVFDVLAPKLKESELRVLLYIVRRTFGFGKNADAISLRQMTEGITRRDGKVIDHGTGMSKRAVIQGAKGLVEKGVIEIIRRKKAKGHNAVNIYRLRFKDNPRVVTEDNPPGALQSPPAVTAGHPQETVKQESESHNNNVVDKEENNPENKALYHELKAIGVRDDTAAELMARHQEQRISEIIEYLKHRIEQGWIPDVSPAAWAVAAVRNNYDISVDSCGTGLPPVDPAEAAEVVELQQKRLDEEVSKAREEELQSLGISAEVDQMWLEIQERMRAEGIWGPALASTFLKIDGKTAVLMVPRLLEEAVTAMESDIMEGLLGDERVGSRVQEIEIRHQSPELREEPSE